MWLGGGGGGGEKEEGEEERGITKVRRITNVCMHMYVGNSIIHTTHHKRKACMECNKTFPVVGGDKNAVTCINI